LNLLKSKSGAGKESTNQGGKKI